LIVLTMSRNSRNSPQPLVASCLQSNNIQAQKSTPSQNNTIRCILLCTVLNKNKHSVMQNSTTNKYAYSIGKRNTFLSHDLTRKSQSNPMKQRPSETNTLAWLHNLFATDRTRTVFTVCTGICHWSTACAKHNTLTLHVASITTTELPKEMYCNWCTCLCHRGAELTTADRPFVAHGTRTTGPTKQNTSLTHNKRL
jgi:hypothetical protein